LTVFIQHSDYQTTENTVLKSMYSRLFSILALFLTGATSLSATTWYVDGTAIGSNNGTSWTNAWTNLSSISGVKGGDTVYISGGPSGSSQTYSVNNWAPVGGTSGSIITYQIGQDSAHNGTAIFSGSGTFVNPSSYTSIVGDAGDGKMHFQASGFVTILWWQRGNLASVRLGYINFGQMGSNGMNPEDVMFLDTCSAFEFDHNYLFMTSPTANSWLYFVSTDPSWDGTRFHDNEVHVPGYYRQGPDFIEAGGASGYSIYNNRFIAYNTAAAANNVQHQDGWQDTGGSSYIKIYNNYVANAGNSCFFGDACYSGFTHMWIYNNVGVIAIPMVSGWYPEGITIFPDCDPSTKTFTDVQVMNNIMVDMDSEPAVHMSPLPAYPNAVWNNCSCQNNISINTGVGSPSGSFWLPSGVIAANNVSFNLSSDNGYFVKYVQYGATSDFHLTSAANALIGQGANESAYFTTDFNGNLRPQTGAWCIGPYEYGSSPPPPSLTVSPVAQNATDIDPATAGVQVYEGTVVTYSCQASETSSNTVSWIWSYAVNGGTNIVYASGVGTVPSVQFDYAIGTGSRTYVWTLSATDGMTNASSNLATSVEVVPVANVGLTFQAIAGSIAPPLTVSSNYVSQPVRTTVITNAGAASFNFTLTNAGDYVVEALVNGPNGGANSFYVNIDAQPVDPIMCWNISSTSNFEQRLVSWRGAGTDTNNQYVPKIFTLAAGAHQIIFAGREPNTELQSFSILPLPATSQNIRVLPTVSGTALNFNAGP
jgi:hypothetical protein